MAYAVKYTVNKDEMQIRSRTTKRQRKEVSQSVYASISQPNHSREHIGTNKLTLNTIHLSSNDKLDIPKFRSDNATPLDVGVDVATPA